MKKPDFRRLFEDVVLIVFFIALLFYISTTPACSPYIYGAERPTWRAGA